MAIFNHYAKLVLKKGEKMSFERKCPGSVPDRFNFPEPIVCPNCRHENEIFKDESRIKCEKCETEMKRVDGLAVSCVEWCDKARACFGEERYNEWLKQKQ